MRCFRFVDSASWSGKLRCVEVLEIDENGLASPVLEASTAGKDRKSGAMSHEEAWKLGVRLLEMMKRGEPALPEQK